MGFFGIWLEGLRIGSDRRPVATVEELRDVLSAQAAFVAQKVVTEYCQAKAGRNWHQLSSERVFVDDLTRSRWESFALVAAGLCRTAVMLLPRPVDDRRLVALYADVLDAQTRPAHRQGGWNDRVAAFAGDLAAAREKPPVTVRQLADGAGRAVFDVLPIHVAMRRLDGPMVTSAIAFQMAAVAGKLRRRLNGTALAAALAAGAGGPGRPACGGPSSS